MSDTNSSDNNNNNKQEDSKNEVHITVPENRILMGSTFKPFNIFPSAKEKYSTSGCKPNREDLNLSKSLGFLVHNMMSPEECQYYIQESNKNGYVTVEKEFPQDYRNNERYIGKSKELADLLWERLENQFKMEDLEGIKPYGFDQEGIWIPLGLDDAFTFGKYHPGGRFRPHLDATFAENPDKRSIFTMQIYLNDEYQGGKTNFFLPGDPLALDTHVLDKAVTPKTGTALIFNHDTLHEGAEVTDGTKYILRVDMMFLRIDNHGGAEMSDTQKAELEKARELYFKADSLEKDDKDLQGAIKTYVEAQMLLAKYPSISNKTPPSTTPPTTSTTTPTQSATSAKPKVEITIETIPEFILFHILSTTTVKDVCSFRSINKHFFKVCAKGSLWKLLFIKYFGMESFVYEDQHITENPSLPSKFETATATATTTSKPVGKPASFTTTITSFLGVGKSSQSSSKSKTSSTQGPGNVPSLPPHTTLDNIRKANVTDLCRKLQNLNIHVNWLISFKSIYQYCKTSNFHIIDMGSETIKHCGFSTEFNDQHSFQSLPQKASKHQQYSPHYVMSSMDSYYWQIGNNASNVIQYAVENSLFVTNDSRIECLQEMLKYVLKWSNKKVSVPIVLCISPLMYETRERKLGMVSIIRKLRSTFFRSTLFLVRNSALLTLQAHGLKSGLVLMCGFGTTLFVTIVNGKQKSIVEFPMNGRKIYDALFKRAKEIGGDVKKLWVRQYPEQLVSNWVDHLRVPMDYNKEVFSNDSIETPLYFLPEAMFNPSLLKVDKPGIVEQTLLTLDEIETNSPETFKLINNTVVVTGGVSCFKGFMEKYTKKIKEIRELNIVYSQKDRIYDVLKGAIVDQTISETLHDDDVFSKQEY
eukprot:gene2187-2690_t